MTDTIHLIGEGGGIFKLSLPLPETIQDKLTRGLVRRVNPDGSPFTESDDSVPTLPDSRPALNASKQVWVGWAVKNGADVEEASALTKQDLIEKYGVEPKPAEGGEQPPATGQPEGDQNPEGGEQPPAK